jgi:acyl-CoA thioester hydrolase
MIDSRNTILFRVRYSETDQMGTYYGSHVLEWFECGRTELMRSHGLPYVEVEARGVFMPVSEAQVHYLGRARYDDLLRLTTRVSMPGRARLRFDYVIVHAEDAKPVAEGHTIHAFINRDGRPVRPPEWLVDMIQKAQGQP